MAQDIPNEYYGNGAVNFNGKYDFEYTAGYNYDALPKNTYIGNIKPTTIQAANSNVGLIVYNHQLIYADTCEQTFNVDGLVYKIDVPKGENPFSWINEATIGSEKDNWEFAGWSTSNTVPSSDADIANLKNENSDIKVSNNGEYYAVFKQTRRANFTNTDTDAVGSDPDDIVLTAYDLGGNNSYKNADNWQNDDTIQLPENSYTKGDLVTTGWHDGSNLYSERSAYHLTQDTEFIQGFALINYTWLMNTYNSSATYIDSRTNSAYHPAGSPVSAGVSTNIGNYEGVKYIAAFSNSDMGNTCIITDVRGNTISYSVVMSSSAIRPSGDYTATLYDTAGNEYHTIMRVNGGANCAYFAILNVPPDASIYNASSSSRGSSAKSASVGQYFFR